MAEQIGAIYYTVEADTAKLVSSTGNVDTSLDRLNQRFRQTDRAANDAQFQMTKTAAAVRGLGRETTVATSQLGRLVKMMGGLIAIRGVGGLIEMAEAYGEMAERVRMATSSVEEYELVQQRLLATANGTYRALSEAQEVYIQTSIGLRDMGYSTQEALDVVDSLSYSFVKNATSTDKAQSALNALTRAVNRGTVLTDHWASLLIAVPTILEDIADAAGMSTQEISKMGYEGKLSSDLLTEGLRKSLQSNKRAADDMATTVRDAFTNLRTNLAAFLGEANRANGATNVLAKSIELFGQNIETTVKLLGVAGAGALARYVAQIGASTVAKGRAIIAARAQAAEELRLAQAHAATTRQALAHAQANAGLTSTHAAATSAATAHAAAMGRLQAAQAATASVTRGLLGVLGGPAGIIAMLAVGALSFGDFGRKAKEASVDVDALADSIRSLTAAEIENQQIKLERSIEELEASARSLRTELAHNEKTFEELAASGNHTEEELRNVREVVSDIRVELEQTEGRLAKAIELQGQLASRAAELAGETSAAAAAQRELNAAMKGFDGATGDALAKMHERVGAMQDGNSEVKKAERYLASLGDTVSDSFRSAYMSAAHALDSIREANERSKKSTKEGADEAKRFADKQAENRKVIEGLAQSLYEAGLAGEALAVAKVRANLNDAVTPEEVAQAEALARAIWQVSEAEQNRQLLRQADPMANEQDRFQEEIENLRKLNEAKLIEDQRYLDLKAQAEIAHAENMRLLQEQNFRAQSEWNEIMMASLDHLQTAGTNAITGLITGASDGTEAMRMLGQAIMQEVVGSFVKMGIAQVKAWVMGRAAQAAAAAGYVASVTGQVAANTALAAQAAFASTAAIPIVGPAMAPGAAAAAAGIAAGLGAPAIAGASATLAGARQYGGPVGAGKMYRINETGAPEILNTASGKQFLLPNTRGQVVSNKDATAQDGLMAPRVTVNLIEDASRGGDIDQRQGGEQEEIIDVFVADIRGDGRASRALEATYGLRRQGR